MNFTQLYDCLLEAKTKGITINTVILKLITEALKKAPKMNATLQYSSFLAAGKLETHDEIAITLPMTFPSGKMMSVRMHHFENKTLCQMQPTTLRNNIKRFVTKCHEPFFVYVFHTRQAAPYSRRLRSAYPTGFLRVSYGFSTGFIRRNT